MHSIDNLAHNRNVRGSPVEEHQAICCKPIKLIVA